MGKQERERVIERPMRKWENNIKMDIERRW
jgi:hypothetical protein